MEIDPKHLATLHLIRERGGLTAAAALLGTSQPALSRLVSDLEIRLGAPLFDRSTRPWRMTALGDSLASQGSAIRAAVSRAGNAVEQFRGGTEGLLKLGGTPYLSDGVLMPLVAAFQCDEPKVRIDITQAYLTALLRRLRRRELDLVVSPVDTMDISQGLASTRLTNARNTIACRQNHPLTSIRKPSFNALLRYRWVAPPGDSPLEADMRNIFNKLGDESPKTALSGGSLSATVQMLEQTDCLAVLPSYVVSNLMRRYAITAVDLELSTPTRSVALITNADDVRPFLLNRFSDYLVQHFPKVTDTSP